MSSDDKQGCGRLFLLVVWVLMSIFTYPYVKDDYLKQGRTWTYGARVICVGASAIWPMYWFITGAEWAAKTKIPE